MQDEKEVASRGFGWGKLFLFVIIVLIIVGVALYSFFHINPMDLIKSGFDGIYQRMAQTVDASKEKVRDMLTYDAAKPMSFCVADGSMVAVSISDVRLIENNGKEKWYVPVTLKKPFVLSDQGDILVADLEGRFFGIIRDGGMLWEKNLDEDIVNVSLSESFILVITKSAESGYKRTIHAYSRDGQEVSLRSIADYYPFAAYHFPQYDKARFVTCGVETQGLETSSLFEFLDLSMNQKGSMKGENEIFTGALPVGSGRVLLYGEKSLVCMDPALGTLWKNDLKEDFLTSITYIKDKTIITSVLDGELLNRENHQSTKVQMLDIHGKLKNEMVVDSLVTAIEASGRTIAFVAGSEVYFINDKGEVMDRYTAHGNVKQVLMANENLAYIITSDTVVGVKVNVTNKFLGIF